VKRVRGSFFMELFLWIILIIPGLIYSLWRLTTVQQVCSSCGASELIPPDTPKARQLLSTN